MPTNIEAERVRVKEVHHKLTFSYAHHEEKYSTTRKTKACQDSLRFVHWVARRCRQRFRQWFSTFQRLPKRLPRRLATMAISIGKLLINTGFTAWRYLNAILGDHDFVRKSIVGLLTCDFQMKLANFHRKLIFSGIHLHGSTNDSSPAAQKLDTWKLVN